MESSMSPNEILSSCNKELLALNKFNKSISSSKCSYDKGYISQEIFSCLTCQKELGKEAIVCLGCSFKCHKDHELLALYFKRDVKCDCGNSRFASPCNLKKDKDYENSLNVYGHNFFGKYCYCDKEDDDSSMIQCLICEDWFHAKCLKVYGGEDMLSKGDLICKKCFQDKIKYIIDGYDIEKYLAPLPEKETSEEKKENSQEEKTEPKEKEKTEETKPKKEKDSKTFTPSKRKFESNENPECLYSKGQTEKSKKIISDIVSAGNEVVVSGLDFENILCRCPECVTVYKEKGVPFLSKKFYSEDWKARILLEDEIEKEADDQTTDENKQILSDIDNVNILQTNQVRSLDVEKQIELNMMTNEFFAEFKEYIKKLKDSNPSSELLVTKEHVEEFLKKFRQKVDTV